MWILLGCAVLSGLLMFGLEGEEERAAKKALKEGKISAGSNEDYEGENYEAVVKQLQALGFENITTVDLDDSGIAFWSNEKVESISISGDTIFESNDYYSPNENIVVTYH